MTNFDIKSLFTNIPLKETNICVDKLSHNETKFNNFSKECFKSLSELAT